jgi:hypothetical protein
MILRALLVICVSLACTGCPVLQELDKSNAAMERYDKTKKTKTNAGSSAKETRPPGSLAEKKAQVQKGMKQWWQEARSLNTGEIDEGIVRCQIRGGTEYMQRDDCLSHGGEPHSAS